MEKYDSFEAIKHWIKDKEHFSVAIDILYIYRNIL